MPNGKKYRTKLMPTVIALALVASGFGIPAAHDAFANDASDVPIREEQLFTEEGVTDSALPSDSTVEAEDVADSVLPNENTAEAERDASEALPSESAADASAGSDGPIPVGEGGSSPDAENSKEADETLLLKVADTASGIVLMALESEPFALADEPVALADGVAAQADYPDGIHWECVENGFGEVGTCVWGIDAATKTLYIRPPDGAETGTLPSIYEVANDGKTATPWQKSGAKKAVILPGVIAGDHCSLFYSSPSLTKVEGLENLDITNTTTLAGMFLMCPLEEVKLPNWNAPNLVDMQYMFAMNNKLTEIVFGNMYAPKLESLFSTFWACKTLETVDLSGLYAPNITDMTSTFSQDWKLVSVIWPAHLDTSNVFSLYATFEECKSLGHLDLSEFDTSRVLYMMDMFADSTITWLDISSFDMTNVRDAQDMFSGANIKKVSIGPRMPVDQLNAKPHWYMLEGNPCDNGRIVDGASGTYVIVEKVVVSEATKSLPVGSSPFTLTATIVPESVKMSVNWKSSNTSVATVDQNGKVTMHSAGYANITAECLGVTGRCTVYVVSLALDEPKTVGIKAAPFKMKATLTPSSAKDPITWTSSKPDVASISSSKANVTVTPKSAGTTTLTVECAGATATCTVTVAAMSMKEPTKTAYVGEEPFQLVADVLPESVTAPVLWASSDTTTATVDKHGFVTPLKKGTATITATLDGIGDVDTTCVVTVQNAVVTMAEAEKTVSVNADPFTLDATVEPDTVTQPLTWSSSDESVATVDSDGKVTVLKTGKTTITARCADAEDSCSLTVASLTLSEKARKVGVDASPFKLTATIEPSSSRSVTWKSSDLDVAAVDPDGNVTVKGAGHAIITAELDGATDVKDTFDLTVVSVNLRETSKTVQEDAEPFMMEAVVIPETLADDLSWSSSDPSVATVDSKGQVTVRGAGYTEITAEVGEFKDTCALTVEELPSSTFVSFREATKRVRVDAEPFFLAIDISSNKTVGPVTWSSSDPSVATVEPVIGASVASISRVANSASCKVVVRKPGTVEISAEVDGTKDTCVLTVDDIDLPEDPDDPSNPSDPGGPGESTGSDDGSNTADDPSNAPGNKGDGSGSGGGSSHDLFTTLHALSDTSDGSGMIFFAAASALSSAVILLLTMRSTRKVRRKGSRL